MTMAKILGKPAEKRTYTPETRFVLPATLIGMEYEYEGVENPGIVTGSTNPLASFWSQHREDSLKDHGAEFVFREPLFGRDAYTAIEFLMDAAQEAKWKCSLRCGIHVHIDVRDLEVMQLIGMTMAYTIVEPVLYQWIGDNRENGIFCVPFYKADHALLAACNIVHSALSDIQMGGHSSIQAAEEFERYAGYNLQALAKFGSVEFRHMRTTHDKGRVFDWINMIMALKAVSYKLPESDGAVVKMAEAMRSSAFLEYVFGERLAAQLWTKETETLITEIGIPTARDLALNGCSSGNWAAGQYPKGENLGFKRFVEKDELEQKAKEAREKHTLAQLNRDYRNMVRDGLLAPEEALQQQNARMVVMPQVQEAPQQRRELRRPGPNRGARGEGRRNNGQGPERRAPERPPRFLVR